MDNQDNSNNHIDPQAKKPNQFVINGKTCSFYGLALNLGYMIVIPILIFGIGGVLLDKKLDSFPIFVLVGFFLAMTSALTIVFVKMKEIMAGIKKDYPKQSGALPSQKKDKIS